MSQIVDFSKAQRKKKSKHPNHDLSPLEALQLAIDHIKEGNEYQRCVVILDNSGDSDSFTAVSARMTYDELTHLLDVVRIHFIVKCPEED